MSQVEVDKIIPQSGTTLTVGESGDTITVPSGATLDTSNSTVTLPDGSWRATLTNTNDSQYVGQFTETTTDNSTYNIASSAYGSVSGSNYYVTLVQSFMFDVTNTSTHKIRFKSATPQSGTTRLIGGTGANESEATFIRLGDSV
jgi:hypothetical protein